MPIRKITFISLGLISLCMAIYVFIAINHNHKPEYSRRVSPTSVTDRSASYLKNNLDHVDPLNRLILDYLQRTFNLDWEFSIQKNPVQPLDELQATKEFLAFQRIALPNQLIDTLPLANADPMSQMMMQAANCDHIPLQPDFGELIQANIKRGKYFLTHVAFSLQRMQENNCPYFSFEQQQTIRKEVSDGMVAIIKDVDTSSDLRYEAIAFLIDIGNRNQIQKSWMDQMAQAQLPNGSWSNNAHTTILALWALLKYTRTDASNEPLIRRPNR